jgi:DNA-binding NtrC family response regulator
LERPNRPVDELTRVVDAILRAADLRDEAGIRVIRLSAGDLPPRVVLNAVSRAVEPLGFVLVRADLDLPAGVRAALLHRHLVLVALETEWKGVDAHRAVDWIRDLTGASCRAHLLVILKCSALPSIRPAPVVRERAPRCDARAHATAASASAFIRAGALDRAEAAVHAELAEAAVRQEPPPAAVLVARAEVLFWQGRFAEAAASVHHVPDADRGARFWRALIAWARSTAPLRISVAAAPDYLVAPIRAERLLGVGDEAGALRIARSRRANAGLSPLEDALVSRICRTDRIGGREDHTFVNAAGARGALRFGIRRNVMNMLHNVSTLLERLQDADDDYTALRRGCCWVREQPSAEAAGIVASDGTRFIVSDGVGAADLHDPEVQASLAPGRGRTIANGAVALVTAPVRYGGATIGFAIVRGRRDAAEALGGAAAALASACAPALRGRLDHLSLAAASHTLAPEILGRSPAIAGLREAIAKAAATSFPVLVEGESGTGKELVARAVHRLSPRRDRRFSALNCAALTDELVEAELFGHARGAFTGAINHRAGLFEESHGSTLFLDEVAELSARAQAKLLRVIQEREIRRVGDHLTRPVDVRVVAATNLPLAKAVSAGRFREDLLFRLAVVRLRVPPLRDRIEDVPLLAQTFWRAFTVETGKRAMLSPDALAALCRYDWPGNVRELQNVMASLVVAAPGRGRVAARHVHHVLLSRDDHAAQSTSATLEDARGALERRMIAASLARHGGRCSRAAQELGLSRQGLSKAMKRLGLERVCST